MEALNFHAFEVEGVDGDTVNIALPSNRYSDAASHLGVARLLSAISGGKVGELKLATLKKSSGSRILSVSIESKHRCGRYSALYAEIPKIGESPKWMQEILTACGTRPINAVVDIMNYVMLEVGQPLHAFDAELVSDGISVRLAKQGERIITLDGAAFKLTAEDLIIADRKRPLAIAGVKGGKFAEVTKETTRLIIESANFEPVGVYRTARRFNLFTDASARFSHGLSHVLVERGIRRAAQLLQEVCKAKLGDWVDVNYHKPQKTVIKFEVDKFNKLTGLEFNGSTKLTINKNVCLNYLRKLGFVVKGDFVEVPPERLDVTIFEDLTEEIVNLHGYDKLPSAAPRVRLIPSGSEDIITLKDKIRRLLSGWGMSEVYNYSFTGTADGKKMVELENPVSEDKKYLRSNLATSLIKNIEDNWRFFEEVRVFELGRVFAKEKIGIIEKPWLGLAIGIKKGSPFLELKGIVEQLLRGIGLTDFEFVPKGGELRVESDHHVLGHVRHYTGDHSIASCEMDMNELLRVDVEEKEYFPLSKYPSIVRDISILVDPEIRVTEIQNLLENASHTIEDVDLIDWYEDAKLGDKKSLTFRLVFQSPERTLKEQEVDRQMAKIVVRLRSKFDAEIR